MPLASSNDDETKKWESKQQAVESKLSNPEVIATMILRVKPPINNSISSDSLASTARPADKDIQFRDYHIDIEYEEPDQKMQTMRINGPRILFPVFTPEREAEITKAILSQETEKAPEKSR